MRTSAANVLYIAVSEMRRGELAETLEPPVQAEVIPNLVDVARLFGLSPEIRASLASLDLAGRDLIFFLPARLQMRQEHRICPQCDPAAVRDGFQPRCSSSPATRRGRVKEARVTPTICASRCRRSSSATSSSSANSSRCRTTRCAIFTCWPTVSSSPASGRASACPSSRRVCLAAAGLVREDAGLLGGGGRRLLPTRGSRRDSQGHRLAAGNSRRFARIGAAARCSIRRLSTGNTTSPSSSSSRPRPASLFSP